MRLDDGFSFKGIHIYNVMIRHNGVVSYIPVVVGLYYGILAFYWRTVLIKVPDEGMNGTNVRVDTVLFTLHFLRHFVPAEDIIHNL